jgi:hypothetical protein
MYNSGTRFRGTMTGLALAAGLLGLGGAGMLLSSRYSPELAYTKPSARQVQPAPVGSARPPQAPRPYGQLPLVFEKNQGQTDPQVQFLARGGGYMMFFTGRELVMQFGRNRRPARRDRPLPLIPYPAVSSLDRGVSAPARDIEPVVKMKLQGSNPWPPAQGLQRLPGSSHYFIGNDPKKWHTNVPQYARLQFNDVYPGIDMVYYDNHHRLEYDFVVAPGADPRAIRLAFDGVDRLRLDAQGNLVLSVAGKEFRQAKPQVRQAIDGGIREVAVHYEIAQATAKSPWRWRTTTAPGR